MATSGVLSHTVRPFAQCWKTLWSMTCSFKCHWLGTQIQKTASLAFQERHGVPLKVLVVRTAWSPSIPSNVLLTFNSFLFSIVLIRKLLEAFDTLNDLTTGWCDIRVIYEKQQNIDIYVTLWVSVKLLKLFIWQQFLIRKLCWNVFGSLNRNQMLSSPNFKKLDLFWGSWGPQYRPYSDSRLHNWKKTVALHWGLAFGFTPIVRLPSHCCSPPYKARVVFVHSSICPAPQRLSNILLDLDLLEFEVRYTTVDPI